MRKMKDSGVEWIGEIPEKWNICRVKDAATVFRGGSPRPIDEYLTNDAEGYNWIKIGDTQKGNRYINSVAQRIKPSGLSKTRFVTEGTLLLTNSMSFGEAYILNTNGCIHDGWLSFSNYQGVTKEFLYYFFVSPLSELQFQQQVAGGVVQNLNIDKVKGTYILLPPIDEQKIIVDYLDEKCSKIDAIIARQEEIIEKLKEYKLSIITEVVTKGVNSEVEMKESGIDICKEIPINWKTSQIRHLFQLRDEKNYKPLEEVQLLYLYTDLGVFPHGEQEERGNKAVKAEGYKVVYDGDIVVNIILAWMGAIGRSAYNGVTSPAYDIYKPLEGVCSEYYHYMFRTKVFSGECYKYGRGIMAMRWRTYSSEFKSIKVPVPPYEEQKTIAKYLDKKCSMLDKTIGDRRSAIEKLQAYKKSLIYEVVTGKKEV